jgi:hypothetical protein
MKAGEALGRIGGAEAESAVAGALQTESNPVVADALTIAYASRNQHDALDVANEDEIDWLLVRQCLGRAEKRDAASMRVEEVDTSDVGALSAVLSRVLELDADELLQFRGEGERRTLVLLNTTYHRLSQALPDDVE